MIDINKKYRTRDGREVRIYATEGYGSYSVHGAVLTEEGWFPRCWTEHGELSHARLAHSAHDLIEVRPRYKRTVWLNMYEIDEYHVGSISWDSWDSKELADERKMNNRIACVKVELDFEEGEGL